MGSIEEGGSKAWKDIEKAGSDISAFAKDAGNGELPMKRKFRVWSGGARL